MARYRRYAHEVCCIGDIKKALKLEDASSEELMAYKAEFTVRLANQLIVKTLYAHY